MDKRMLFTCLALAASTSLILSTSVSADFGAEDTHQELFQNLDCNGDGKIGPREYRANHRFLTQVDRRR